MITGRESLNQVVARNRALEFVRFETRLQNRVAPSGPVPTGPVALAGPRLRLEAAASERLAAVRFGGASYLSQDVISGEHAPSLFRDRLVRHEAPIAQAIALPTPASRAGAVVSLAVAGADPARLVP